MTSDLKLKQAWVQGYNFAKWNAEVGYFFAGLGSAARYRVGNKHELIKAFKAGGIEYLDKCDIAIDREGIVTKLERKSA